MPAGELRFPSHLYKSRDLVPTTIVLMTATLDTQREVREPIAWINVSEQRKTFYTSLGSPEDFATPPFRRLLLNAVLWSVNLPIPPAEAGIAP